MVCCGQLRAAVASVPLSLNPAISPIQQSCTSHLLRSATLARVGTLLPYAQPCAVLWQLLFHAAPDWITSHVSLPRQKEVQPDRLKLGPSKLHTQWLCSWPSQAMTGTEQKCGTRTDGCNACSSGVALRVCRPSKWLGSPTTRSGPPVLLRSCWRGRSYPGTTWTQPWVFQTCRRLPGKHLVASG